MEEARAKKEALEKAFALQILGARLPAPVQQFMFHNERKWRFDFAWPEKKIAFEVQGGIYTQGGHTRAKGYNNDCEKGNEARLLGWRVFAVTTDHISSGMALKWVERALFESDLSK